MRIQVFKANEQGLRSVLILPSLRRHKSPILVEGLSRAELRPWLEEAIKTVWPFPARAPD